MDKIVPKTEKAYIGLADAYIGLGDYESAIKSLDRGIQKMNSIKLKDHRNDVQKEWVGEEVKCYKQVIF